MGKKPKAIVGLVILLLTLIFIAILISQNKRSSSFSIFPKQNQFRLEFNLTPEDKPKALEILGRLKLPENITDSVTFEIDSTSSAKLAVVSPISANLKFSKDTIAFHGQLKRPAVNRSFVPKSFKLPKSTNIASASPTLTNLAQNRLYYPQKLVEWIIASNSGDSLQYFFNFENYNVLVFASEAPLEDLKKLEDDNFTYKEDIQEDSKIVLIAYQNLKTKQNETIALTKLNDLTYVFSSPEAAKAFLDFQKNPQDAIHFPQKQKEKVTYVLFIKNNNEEFINILTGTFLSAKPETVSFIENIDSFYFSLAIDEFSGLINFRGN